LSNENDMFPTCEDHVMSGIWRESPISNKIWRTMRM